MNLAHDIRSTMNASNPPRRDVAGNTFPPVTKGDEDARLAALENAVAALAKAVSDLTDGVVAELERGRGSG